MKEMAFSIILSLILYLSTFHTGCGDYKAYDSCTKRSDCYENMVCVDNECTVCDPAGNKCHADSCCDGFYCRGGACILCPIPRVAPCKSDNDCQVGQNCEDLICYGGLCEPKSITSCLKQFDTCDCLDDKCCPGLGCYLGGDQCGTLKANNELCGSDNECVEGYKCYSSSCHLCGPTAPCSSDSNCCYGNTCVNGKCHNPNGDNCFGEDSHCMSSDNCCIGLRCSSESGTCKPCKAYGPCSQEDQNCCTGYVCNKSQQCQLCPGSTDTNFLCHNDTDCAVGDCPGPITVCNDNVCVPSICIDNNRICNENRLCCKGLVCKAGNCIPCHGYGQTCSTSVDCCDSYWCNGGKCDSCVGTTCTNNLSCKSLCNDDLRCFESKCQPP